MARFATRLAAVGVLAVGVLAGGAVAVSDQPDFDPGVLGAIAADGIEPASDTDVGYSPVALRVTWKGAAAGDCGTGAYQRTVETYLSVIGTYGTPTVDGVQSATDCAVIRGFQDRFGIRPAAGQADAVTADVARRIASSLNAGEQAKCGASAALTVCVDLTLQTAWVVQGGAVVWGPTVVRTGFRGHATPAGRYTINKRNIKEWSNPYRVWLPYWQRFYGGMGLHETTTYLHDAGRGSHGCVNLLHTDAVGMWNLLKRGSVVRTFGRRAGT